MLRIGLIGCGNISRAHITAWKAYQDKAAITCVVDINESYAREVAKDLGCEWSTDYMSILDKVDAVDICTPHNLHYEQTKNAMLKGKHVLLEKPMSNRISEAEDLISICNRQDVILMIAYVLRYRREFNILRQEIQSGKWGRPILCYAHTVDYLNYVPDWIRDHDGFPNGVLFSHGCHYVDLMCLLFGEIDTVTCHTAKEIRPASDWLGEDTASISMRFKNGVIGTFLNSWATGYYQWPLKFDVYMEKALLSVEYDAKANRRTIRRDSDGEHILFEFKIDDTSAMDAFGTSKDMFQQIEHFISCMNNRTKPETSPEEGLISIKAIFAGMEGENKRRYISPSEVSIDGLLDVYNT